MSAVQTAVERAIPLALWRDLVIHYVYLCIRLVVCGFDRVFFLLNHTELWSVTSLERFFGLRGSTSQLLTIERIIYRHRVRVMDFSTEHQFLTLLENALVTPEIVLEDCFQLYTINLHYAYFVKLPNPRRDYLASLAPFARVKMWKEATHLVCLPVPVLKTLAREVPEDFRLLMITASARCGSTLLTKMLARARRQTTVIACPGALTQLCFLQNFTPKEELKAILKCSIKLLCKPNSYSADRTFAMKFMCFEMCLHQLIQELFTPDNVRFVFITRGVLPNIMSWRRTMYGNGFFSMLMLRIRYNSLCQQFLSNRLICKLSFVKNFLEYRLATILFTHETLSNLDCLQPTAFEAAALGWTDAQCLHKQLASKIEVPTVTYEMLLKQPVESIEQILSSAAIDTKQIDRNGVIDELSVDSQGGTPFSQTNTKKVISKEEISPMTLQRLENFWNRIGLKTEL